MFFRIALAFVTLLFLFTNPLSAQEDLTESQSYFESQGEVYQRWLESSGLDQVLEVNDVRVGKDYASIRLLIPLEDTEKAAGAWQAIKDSFELQSTFTLEEQLFYKALVMLDIPQEQVFVTVRNSYRKKLPFFRSISFQEGELKIKEDNPRAKITNVDLIKDTIGGGAEPGIAAFSQPFTKEEVFDCIVNYVTTRYTERECFDKKPELTIQENGKKLRFKIKGLCREVIPEENTLIKSVLQTFGFAENWYKRELLYFTISYVATPEGAQLVIVLEGKFGSGLYQSVNERGYILMETDFNDELETYTDSFGISLGGILENCGQ